MEKSTFFLLTVNKRKLSLVNENQAPECPGLGPSHFGTGNTKEKERKKEITQVPLPRPFCSPQHGLGTHSQGLINSQKDRMTDYDPRFADEEGSSEGLSVQGYPTRESTEVRTLHRLLCSAPGWLHLLPAACDSMGSSLPAVRPPQASNALECGRVSRAGWSQGNRAEDLTGPPCDQTG